MYSKYIPLQGNLDYAPAFLLCHHMLKIQMSRAYTEQVYNPYQTPLRQYSSYLMIDCKIFVSQYESFFPIPVKTKYDFPGQWYQFHPSESPVFGWFSKDYPLSNSNATEKHLPDTKKSTKVSETKQTKKSKIEYNKQEQEGWRKRERVSERLDIFWPLATEQEEEENLLVVTREKPLSLADIKRDSKSKVGAVLNKVVDDDDE